MITSQMSNDEKKPYVFFSLYPLTLDFYQAHLKLFPPQIMSLVEISRINVVEHI